MFLSSLSYLFILCTIYKNQNFLLLVVPTFLYSSFFIFDFLKINFFIHFGGVILLLFFKFLELKLSLFQFCLLMNLLKAYTFPPGNCFRPSTTSGCILSLFIFNSLDFIFSLSYLERLWEIYICRRIFLVLLSFSCLTVFYSFWPEHCSFLELVGVLFVANTLSVFVNNPINVCKVLICLSC